MKKFAVYALKTIRKEVRREELYSPLYGMFILYTALSIEGKIAKFSHGFEDSLGIEFYWRKIIYRIL